MPDFTQNDFKILMATAVFVIIISFVFPPMGFTADSVNQTDIPSFNASQNQLSFVGEAPPKPSNPTSGTLTYIEGASEYEDNRQVWFQKDEMLISLLNMGTVSNPEIRVSLINFTDSGSLQDYETISEGGYVLLENWSYSVSFENVQISDDNETITADWELHEKPNTGGLLESIPGYSELADVAAILGWFLNLMFHYTLVVFQMITNLGVTVFNILAFIFSTFYWILSTYGSVVSGAPTGWAAVIMLIPGLVMSFEFAKILIILVNTIAGLIPTT